MTPGLDVLTTYTRLRQTQRALNNRLMKTLSKKVIEESAKHLGFFEGGCLVADTESDLDLVMDSAIYDYYPSGNKNAVARFAAQHALEGDERLVLDAMLRARFTLVELGDAVEGIGVHARDLVFAEDFFLADVSLSETSVSGLVLATRLLALESFCMTTGAHVVLDESLASLAHGNWDRLAGRAKEVTPRESSFFARLFLKLGTVEPDEARIMLADYAVSQLPRDDPRRAAYLRLRAERARVEP